MGAVWGFFAVVLGVVVITALAGITMIARMVFGPRPKPQAAIAAPADPKLEAARRKYEAELALLAAHAQTRRTKNFARRVAGVVAAVGSGLLAFGVMMQLDLFPLIGVGSGIMTGALVAWLASMVNDGLDARADDARQAIPVPQRPAIAAPPVQGQGLPTGRADLIQRVLADAAGALQKLDATVPKLRQPDSIAHVAQLVATGNRLMKAVAENPDHLATAQRVFTYYCPETVKVAEALMALESSANPDVERIQATQTILKKLAALFDKTELELRQGDGQALDIDLRLLDQSLQADLKLV